METEWTERDYAEAALDMLPNSAEEIEAFLADQGIKNVRAYPRAKMCPVSLWISRWSGNHVWVGWHLATLLDNGNLPLPPAVIEYVIEADRAIQF